ncbi:MAG: hypothetical protein KDA47_02840, partial [Planctomycetales bacterium]|nr:hypothetical protein [Planctomycetales bacterium]
MRCWMMKFSRFVALGAIAAMLLTANVSLAQTGAAPFDAARFDAATIGADTTPANSTNSAIEATMNDAGMNQAAGDAGGNASADVAPLIDGTAIPTKNLLQVIRDGGTLMIPIGICSFILG